MATHKKIKKEENKALKSQNSPSKTALPNSSISPTGEKVKHVFEHLKKHFEPAKVDEFQKKWLSVPENRKKYEKLTDVPQVAVEEILAMTNDLIDYIQGEKTGKSQLIQKLKTGFTSFFKNPAKFVQKKAEAGKEMVVEMKDSAQEKINGVASDLKNKTKEKDEEVKKVVQSSTKKTAGKALAKVKSKSNKLENRPKKVVKKIDKE